MKFTKLFVGFLLLIFLITGCNSNNLIEVPPSSGTSDNLTSDVSGIKTEPKTPYQGGTFVDFEAKKAFSPAKNTFISDVATKINSKQEYEKYLTDNKANFSFNTEKKLSFISGAMLSFSELKKVYTDDYFKTKSLILVTGEDDYSLVSSGANCVVNKDNSTYLVINRIKTIGESKEKQQYHMFFEIEKDKVQETINVKCINTWDFSVEVYKYLESPQKSEYPQIIKNNTFNEYKQDSSANDKYHDVALYNSNGDFTNPALIDRIMPNEKYFETFGKIIVFLKTDSDNFDYKVSSITNENNEIFINLRRELANKDNQVKKDTEWKLEFSVQKSLLEYDVKLNIE